MLQKIYIGALGISFVILSGLTFYAFNWLQSVGSPANVVLGYEYYANLNWIFLWASSLLLLILANVVLWTTRKAWAMWATFLYFALFMLIQTIWLEQSFHNYKQQNGLTENILPLGILYGVIFCGLAAAIIFFDQFIVKSMQSKMNPPVNPAK